MESSSKKRIGVWKFASCDGCQLTLLDCEDELLLLNDYIEIAYFREATSKPVTGRFDLSIIEGSITTPKQADHVQQIRQLSDKVLTIGACATSGGIQALKNFKDVKAYLSIVYAKPQYISTLETSTAISDHIAVDFELRGCPINKHQLLDVISSFLNNKKANIQPHSVCMECKNAGNVCVMVAQRTPCLGPVTHAGCGALCPSYGRGCYGCYGSKETPHTESLALKLKMLGMSEHDMTRLFRNFNANDETFKQESKRHEKQNPKG